MILFAERNSRIDTENAFKVGPHITHVERQKGAVIKLNLGEPDFSVPQHIKTEIKRYLCLVPIPHRLAEDTNYSGRKIATAH